MHVLLLRTVALVCLLAAGVGAEEPRAILSVARVLSAFEHTCTPIQCEILRAIVKDETASADERVLAGSLMRVLHVPDPRDKPRLLALENDSSVPFEVRTVAGVILRLVHVPSAADRSLLTSVIAGQKSGAVDKQSEGGDHARRKQPSPRRHTPSLSTRSTDRRCQNIPGIPDQPDVSEFAATLLVARLLMQQIDGRLKVTSLGRLGTADIGRLEHACSSALTSPIPKLDIHLRVTKVDEVAVIFLQRLSARGARIISPPGAGEGQDR